MDLKGNGILQLCLNSLSSAERWNGRIQQSATLYQYLAGRDAAVNDAAVQPSFFEGQESFFDRREFYLLNRKNLSRRDKNNKVITSAKAGGNVTIGVCVCVTVYVTVCVTVGKITPKVLIWFSLNFEEMLTADLHLHLYFLCSSSRDVPACFGCRCVMSHRSGRFP